MTTEDLKVIEAMEEYGGSFVQQLARLYRVADLENRIKIRTVFGGYWKDYTVVLTVDLKNETATS